MTIDKKKETLAGKATAGLKSAVRFCDNAGMSPIQRNIIFGGLTMLSIVLIVLSAAVIGIAIVKTLVYFSAALIPVVSGFLLAMICKPLYAPLSRHMPKFLAVLITLLVTLGMLSVVFWCFLTFMISELSDFLPTIPERAKTLISWFNSEFPNIQRYADTIGIPYMEWQNAIKSKAVNGGASLLSGVSNVFNVFLTLIFFLFFVGRPDIKVSGNCLRKVGFVSDSVRMFADRAMRTFVEIIVAYFQRQVLVCVIEGVLLGFLFMAIRLPCGFVLGFLLGLFNLVPIVGNVMVFPALLEGYFGSNGSLFRATEVLVIWIGSLALDNYVLTPRLQGNKTGLGSVGVIFSFVFWSVAFDSVLGLLLAVPLSAFCVSLWKSAFGISTSENDKNTNSVSDAQEKKNGGGLSPQPKNEGENNE